MDVGLDLRTILSLSVVILCGVVESLLTNLILIIYLFYIPVYGGKNTSKLRSSGVYCVLVFTSYYSLPSALLFTHYSERFQLFAAPVNFELLFVLFQTDRNHSYLYNIFFLFSSLCYLIKKNTSVREQWRVSNDLLSI